MLASGRAVVNEPLRLTSRVKANAASKVSLEHLARPSSDPGGNPFHFVIVHVDGEKFSLEVVGVDWGARFNPYRTNATSMGDGKVP